VPCARTALGISVRQRRALRFARRHPSCSTGIATAVTVTPLLSLRFPSMNVMPPFPVLPIEVGRELSFFGAILNKRWFAL